MTKWFPFSLCGLVLLFCACTERSIGEEARPSQSHSIKLDELAERLRTANEAVKAKADALVGIVDAEVQAKRVSAAVSQNLRAALSSMETSGSIDSTALLASASFPMENEAVADAVRGFQAASTRAQNERTAIVRKALPAIENRVTELTRTAVTSSEVVPVLAAVELVQGLPQSQQHAPAGSPAWQLDSLSKCVRYLHALGELLNSKASDDPSALSQTLLKYRNAGQAAREFVADDALRKRLDDTLHPLKASAESTHAALLDALTGRKPYAEVSSALAAYEEAAKRYGVAGSRENVNLLGEAESRIEIYRSLVSLNRSVARQQWDDVKQRLPSVKQSLQRLDDAESLKMEELLERWDREGKAVDEAAAQALRAEMREKRDGIRAKLAQITNPGDLEALAAEVAKMETEMRKNPNSDSLQGLSPQMHSLASAWSGGNPRFFAEGGVRGHMGMTSGFSIEFASLESKIEREVTASKLRTPELNQLPLAEMPLDAAIETLCDKLAAAGEWRRLLQILEAHSETGRSTRGYTYRVEAISSIRSFLAAQNFELAEQWTEAAAAYKSVLRNAAEDTPVKESAMRLKAIAKEHPDEVKAAESLPLNLLRLLGKPGGESPNSR